LLQGNKNGKYKFDILPFEKELMLDTFDDDLIFITARGLALERIFFNHLSLYSESPLSIIVLNTNPEDEHFYLELLKHLGPKYPPKILTADVLSKDRERIYKTGGVQFVTSRIFMVDLLTNRVPLDDIAGILVYRAHEILTGYQESFILRLFRERKQDGFVKAFTDQPSAITRLGLGQLQRLIDRLYVKRVRVLPRFDDGVKSTFEANQPAFVEVSIDLSATQRQIRTCIIDIISTCVRELKQCTHGIELDAEEESNVSASAALGPSRLEIELRKNSLLLTERQERLMTDLRVLRKLLETAENLDPVSLHTCISDLRSNKEFMENNTGWAFSPTAKKIYTSVENQCSSKDDRGQTSITPPPKWKSLEMILNEIKDDLAKDPTVDLTQQPPVLVLASNESTCAQLIDLAKFGSRKLCWLRSKRFAEMEEKSFNSPEPEGQPIWPSDFVALYDEQILEQDKKKLVDAIKKDQKKQGRTKGKKRTAAEKEADNDPKQAKLVSFGIVRYAEKKSTKRPEKVNVAEYLKNASKKDESKSSTSTAVQETEVIQIDDNSQPSIVSAPIGDDAQVLPLLLFTTLAKRYNLITCLESLKPRYLVLYHSDIASTRVIECYAAHNSASRIKLYSMSYTNSTEDERYLISIRNEQFALETLLKDQEILYVPTEYDVTREDASQLRSMSLQADSRRNRRVQPEIEEELQPMVVVDVREFNSELPTIVYKRGIDVQPATLEVGDYILSPNICIERKALDDLAQSLTNGRVFKQAEQMVRTYLNSVLLIESSEKFRKHRVNAGPFQGELSRKSRETRSLLTMLVRANPKLSILWSLSPSHSSELFEELKLDQPNPEIDAAIGIRSDDLGLDDGNDGVKTQKKSRKLNTVVRRQLQSLPILTPMDIERAMQYDKLITVSDFVQVNAETLRVAAAVSQQQAESLVELFHCDFRAANA